MSFDQAVVGFIDGWNLYVLPPVIGLVLVRAALRRSDGPVAERIRTVRLIGLLCLMLAVRSVALIVPECIAKYRYGLFPSLAVVNVVWPLVVAVVNVPIGLGLRRLRRWARWVAIVWNALQVLFLIPIVVFLVRFQASVSAWEWPDLAVTKVLPAVLVVVLLLPRTGRAFATRPEEETPARPSVVGLLVLGFTLAVGSVLAADLLIAMTQFGS